MVLPSKQLVHLSYRGYPLIGKLTVPKNAKGLVIIAWDSSYPPNQTDHQLLIDHLQRNYFGTFELDFKENKTQDHKHYLNSSKNIFVTSSLITATAYLEEMATELDLPVGMLGAGIGAEAVLRAASYLPQIAGIVTLGEIHGLSREELAKIHSPSLLLLESTAYKTFNNMIDLMDKLIKCPRKLELVTPSRTFFNNKENLVKITLLANEWFQKYLKAPSKKQEASNPIIQKKGLEV